VLGDELAMLQRDQGARRPRAMKCTHCGCIYAFGPWGRRSILGRAT
jgi:hypothetical protein